MRLQTITVRHEYPVYFTTDVFSPANPDLLEAISRKEPARRHRLFVIVDEAVASAWPRLLQAIHEYVAHHGRLLELAAEPCAVPGGEVAKNDPGVVPSLQRRLHELRLDRQSFVVVVGGGALLDVAGYAAATVHRGVRLVRLPTTVLAQNDAGIGLKTAVNGFGTKNFLGSFTPPFAVLNDSRFLETLSRRDTVAGTAEAVKIALIRDAAFFRWLQGHAASLAAGDRDALRELIYRCAMLHLDGIAESHDPFELSTPRPHFAHWAAHRLESLSENRLRHGEAVAIGIAIDTVYSVEAGHLAPSALQPVIELLEDLGFTLWHDALEPVERADAPLPLLDGLREHREYLGGDLTVTLLQDIGRGLEVHEIDHQLVRRALRWLRRRHAERRGS